MGTEFVRARWKSAVCASEYQVRLQDEQHRKIKSYYRTDRFCLHGEHLKTAKCNYTWRYANYTHTHTQNIHDLGFLCAFDLDILENLLEKKKKAFRPSPHYCVSNEIELRKRFDELLRLSLISLDSALFAVAFVDKEDYKGTNLWVDGSVYLCRGGGNKSVLGFRCT